jgi:hypothetical protein
MALRRFFDMKYKLAKWPHTSQRPHAARLAESSDNCTGSLLLVNTSPDPLLPSFGADQTASAAQLSLIAKFHGLSHVAGNEYILKSGCL